MTFSADIAAFAQKAGESLDRTVRMVTLELFSAVIKSTPVDEGRARGNWQTTTGSPSSSVLDIRSESATIAELQANAGGAGKVTYLANNLPYIYRLEMGWSTQSPPHAMVRGNFQRIESMISKAARENRV